MNFDPRIVRILRVLCEETDTQEMWLSIGFGGINIGCYAGAWSSKFSKTLNYIRISLNKGATTTYFTNVVALRKHTEKYEDRVCVFNEHSREHCEKLKWSGNYES